MKGKQTQSRVKARVTRLIPHNIVVVGPTDRRIPVNRPVIRRLSRRRVHALIVTRMMIRVVLLLVVVLLIIPSLSALLQPPGKFCFFFV